MTSDMALIERNSLKGITKNMAFYSQFAICDLFLSNVQILIVKVITLAWFFRIQTSLEKLLICDRNLYGRDRDPPPQLF